MAFSWKVSLHSLCKHSDHNIYAILWNPGYTLCTFVADFGIFSKTMCRDFVYQVGEPVILRTTSDSFFSTVLIIKPHNSYFAAILPHTSSRRLAPHALPLHSLSAKIILISRATNSFERFQWTYFLDSVLNFFFSSNLLNFNCVPDASCWPKIYRTKIKMIREYNNHISSIES